MNQEIDIIEMIKSRRYFKLALRELLPSKVRMDLKQRSRYLLIDPDKEQEDQEEVQYEMEFETILDKIEYELNQEDVFLTDGFYSSGEENDIDECKKLHEHSKSVSSSSEYQSA